MCVTVTVYLPENLVPDWYHHATHIDELRQIAREKISLLKDADVFISITSWRSTPSCILAWDEQSIELPININDLLTELGKRTGNIGVDPGWYYYAEKSQIPGKFKVTRARKNGNGSVDFSCVGADPDDYNGAVELAKKMADGVAATFCLNYLNSGVVIMGGLYPQKVTQSFYTDGQHIKHECWFVKEIDCGS